MLGTDLLKEWETDELIPASSNDADVRYLAEQVHSFTPLAHGLRWTVLTAAHTDVDGSERNPEVAFAVNSQWCRECGPSRAANEFGSRLFFVSTDYLFDGTSTRPYEPDEPIAPLNVYGQSKAAGEKAILEHHSDWCIARTSWLFGAAGELLSGENPSCRRNPVGLDRRGRPGGSPTFTCDLARATAISSAWTPEELCM